VASFAYLQVGCDRRTDIHSSEIHNKMQDTHVEIYVRYYINTVKKLMINNNNNNNDNNVRPRIELIPFIIINRNPKY
jgi:hypothetical protein